jgi:proton-dependent oligopeptide transporter, POT family
MEAFERLAFYGVRAVLPLYMVAAKGQGLGLSYKEKGVIYMLWAIAQCLIPMVSGGYTEAYGYRLSMFTAFCLNITGYTVMANAGGFWTMLLAALLVGTGTAIFKPPVQGSVAKSLNAGNSGLGFGIFYWLVNVGGFLGPLAAAALRGNELRPTWSLVFYGAAIATACNFLPAIFLFREPAQDSAARQKKPLKVFTDTMAVLWHDQSMLRFLLVVSGFWFMFMQLWDLLPNFIDEWVDTRDVGHLLSATLGTTASSFLNAGGGAKPEILINIDSFAIILLVLPLSWLFGRYKMITALVLGMMLALAGFVLSGLTNVGMVASIGIFVFAIGEIICSPKFSEYVGMTAPPDRKAQYMGYSNIPFAIGWAAGNGLSGPLYDTFASRTALARQYLVEKLGMLPDAARAVADKDLLSTIAARLGSSATPHDAINALWHAYHPWVIWLILGAVGLASVVGMIALHRKSPDR